MSELKGFSFSGMHILGIGGLPGVKAFKRFHWPNLDDREYAISLGIDAAAALVVNGELIIAAREESFNRSLQTEDFPANAIDYCLSTKNLGSDEIDLLVHCFDYSDYEGLYLLSKRSAEFYRTVLSRAALLKEICRHLPAFPSDRVRQIENHRAHAAGAYLTSGWEECLVVVIDGLGDGKSTTGYNASARGLIEIKEIAAYDSIAIFYSLVSVHLGFNWQGDEWHLMDLAPQGDASRFRAFFEQSVQLRENGSILIAPLRLNRRSGDRENYLATRRYLLDYLGPKRLPPEQIQQRHKDVGAGLQECVNRVLLHICKHLAETAGERRIALTGQLALNCSANGHLLQSGIFEEVYIPTATGDDGAAIGAALYFAWQKEEATSLRVPTLQGAPSYPLEEIQAAYGRFARQIRIKPFASIDQKCRMVAALVAADHIVAWDAVRKASGRSLFSDRSILANPSDPVMRERLGVLLKEPIGSRPVAAAVTTEQASRWFELPRGIQLNGAVLTVPVKSSFQKELTAVTQADGTARIQAIDRRDHPELHRILREVGKLTGREIVLTTPFNVAGRPVVDSPLDALEVFLQIGIEYLVLGDDLILRTENQVSQAVTAASITSLG